MSKEILNNPLSESLFDKKVDGNANENLTEEEKIEEKKAKEHIEKEKTREKVPSEKALDDFFDSDDKDGGTWLDEAIREHEHDVKIAKQQKQNTLTPQEYQTLEDIQKRGELFSFGLDKSFMEIAFNEELSPVVKNFLASIHGFREALVSALIKCGIIQSNKELIDWLNKLSQQLPEENRDLFWHEIREAKQPKKELGTGVVLRRLRNLVRAIEVDVEESVATKESNFIARLGTLSHKVMRLVFEKGYVGKDEKREKTHEEIERLWHKMIELIKSPEQFINNHNSAYGLFLDLEQEIENLVGDSLPSFFSRDASDNETLFNSNLRKDKFSDILHKEDDAWHKYLACLTLMSWASVLLSLKKHPPADNIKLFFEAPAQVDNFQGKRKIDLVVAKAKKIKKQLPKLVDNPHIGQIIDWADEIKIYDFKFLTLREPPKQRRAWLADEMNMKDYFLRAVIACCAGQKGQGPQRFGQLPLIKEKIDCALIYISPFSKPHYVKIGQAPFALGEEADSAINDFMNMAKQTKEAQRIADLDQLAENIINQLRAKKPPKRKKQEGQSPAHEFLKYYAWFGKID